MSLNNVSEVTGDDDIAGQFQEPCAANATCWALGVLPTFKARGSLFAGQCSPYIAVDFIV